MRFAYIFKPLVSLVVLVAVATGVTIIAKKHAGTPTASPQAAQTKRSVVAESETDTDGDGRADWEEMLAHTDPLTPDTAPASSRTSPESTRNQGSTLTSDPFYLLSSARLLLQKSASQVLLTAPTPAVNTSDTGGEAEFYTEYAKLGTSITFSPEELTAMRTTSVGNAGRERPLTLEELLDLIKRGQGDASVRTSLAAWAHLDAQMAQAIKTLAVSGDGASAQEELANWFAYHSSVATRLAAPGISQEEIADISLEYAGRAQAHLAAFGKGIARAEQASPDRFTLINRAEAFTCPSFSPPNLYNFGGRVTLIEPCNFGIVDTISPPCGGLIFFSWASLSANPFLFQYGPWVIADAIKGRSTVVPGICPLGVPPAVVPFPYQSIVIFFGAAAVPSVPGL